MEAGELLGAAILAEKGDGLAVTIMLLAQDSVREGDMGGMAKAAGYLAALSAMRDSSEIDAAAIALVAWMAGEIEAINRPRGMVN